MEHKVIIRIHGVIFDTAVGCSQYYSGIGFMFANGYFGVDIDNVQDEIEDYKTGGNGNIVAEFIHSLQSI